MALVHHDGVAHRYAALRGGLVRWIERNHHRDSRRQAGAAAAAAAAGGRVYRCSTSCKPSDSGGLPTNPL
jgi:hypothetical protein